MDLDPGFADTCSNTRPLSPCHAMTVRPWAIACLVTILAGCNDLGDDADSDAVGLDASSEDGVSIDVAEGGDGGGVDDDGDGTDDGAAADNGGVDAGSGDAVEPSTCETNDDCGGGEVCVDGTCVAVCFGDGDCPDGLVCDEAANACVDCLDDDDCGDGEVCTDGSCIGGCADNSECAGGELCQDGVCVALCFSADDCGEGEVCDGGACVPEDDGGDDCTNSSDCRGGFACVGGECIPIGGGGCDGDESECLSDDAGRACVDGAWEPFVCDDDETCEGGACAGTSDGTCDRPGEVYCDGDAIVVCDDAGAEAARLPCGTGEECADGECVDRACTPDDDFCIDERVLARCNADADVFFEEDCHLQQVCDGGECVFADGANACEGDVILEALPGEPCGDCGTWICGEPNAVSCDDPGFNACGVCIALEVEIGAECGDCGAWACAEDGTAACADPGLNGCGACGELEGAPGSACGDCGVWVCGEGGWGGVAEGTVGCDDPGANECGGCADLATFPGAWCDDSGASIQVCDGDDRLECVANRADSCFTAIECNFWAARFGIFDPLSIGCDPDVGCYLKGQCSPDGIPTEADPFGSACVGRSTCTVVPIVGTQLCTGCSVVDPSTCRRGEECRDLLFGLFQVCMDPLSIIPGT